MADLKLQWNQALTQYTQETNNMTKQRDTERQDYETKLSELRKEMMNQVKEKHLMESDIRETRFKQQIEFNSKLKTAETAQQTAEMRCGDIQRKYNDQERMIKQLETDLRQSKADADKLKVETRWLNESKDFQSTQLSDAKKKINELEQKVKELQRGGNKDLFSFTLGSLTNSMMSNSSSPSSSSLLFASPTFDPSVAATGSSFLTKKE